MNNGYNRIEALKEAIEDGFVSNAMVSAEFFLLKKKITQDQFDELKALAYPTDKESGETIESN